MSKLHHRKFARFFPSYHPRAGEPTYFVEKIWNSVGMPSFEDGKPWGSGWEDTPLTDEYWRCIRGIDEIEEFDKHHTIRAGHHVKPGDFIRPSVWSGKPYAIKPIIIGPDIEVVKTWDFEFKPSHFSINGRVYDGEIEGHHELLERIANNDGLSDRDFKDLFLLQKKNEPSQIICWNKSIEY